MRNILSRHWYLIVYPGIATLDFIEFLRTGNLVWVGIAAFMLFLGGGLAYLDHKIRKLREAGDRVFLSNWKEE